MISRVPAPARRLVVSQDEVDAADGDAGVAELVVAEVVHEPLHVGREGWQVLKENPHSETDSNQTHSIMLYSR